MRIEYWWNDTLGHCFSTPGPRPGTGPLEVLLEFVILVFQAFFMKYSEEKNILECVEKLRHKRSK
jgi:hypothetical protein